MSKSLHTPSYRGGLARGWVADDAGSRYPLTTSGGIPPRPFRIRYGA